MGTVYGTRRPGLPRDPLMRMALAVGLVGVLLGVLFGTGVLGGGDPTPAPTVAAAAGSPTPAEPSPTEAEPPPTTEAP
ncbi:hypothetical protein C1I95_07440, partial [Micromonospora craterilacus]